MPTISQSGWPNVFQAIDYEGADSNYYFGINGISNVNNSLYITVGDIGRVDIELIVLGIE